MNMPLLSSDSNLQPPDLKELGIYHDVIKNAAGDTLPLLSPGFIKQLNKHVFDLPTWYTQAPESQRLALKTSQALNHTSLEALDSLLDRVGSVESFAVPLLEQAIQTEFGITCNVKRNVITLTTLNAFTHEIERSDTQTLLQAALHNFEPGQAEAGGIPWGSHLWNYKSTHSSDPAPLLIPIEPVDFASLCRRLDIGARYQQHLEAIFNPRSVHEKMQLEQLCIRHERHALRLQADIALMKKDIGATTHATLISYCEGNDSALFNGQLLACESMALDDINLHTLIVFHAPSLALDPSCVVYIPGDPVSCLKQYPSLQDAHSDLMEKMKAESYRNFFIHLAPQSQKLKLSKRLAARFNSGMHDPLYMQPSQLQTPLFDHLYQYKTRQLFNDARFLAVPTAQINRLSLLNRIEHYADVTLNILNLAALFVPGLGEVMMTVFAAQIMTDLYHGIEAWEDDEKSLAWSYTQGVLFNLGLVAIAGKIAAEGLKPVAVSVSPFVEELELVQLPQGQTRLWKPDLTPFEHGVELDTSSTPNNLGLHTHQGKTYLPLEGKYYRVQQAADNNWYLQHPTDPQSYTPQIWHNGKGAWRHEAEELGQWSESRLVRRLNNTLRGLTDEQAQGLMHASHIDEAILNQVHSDLVPMPALLEDVTGRFRIKQDLEQFVRKMRGNDTTADPLLQLQLLVDVEFWPRSKALRCLDNQGNTIMEYGHPPGSKVPVIQILDSQIRRGDLLKTVLQSLDANEVHALTGNGFVSSLEEQVARLSTKIADRAGQLGDELFRSRYAGVNISSDPLVNTLTQAYPSLPVCAAQEVIDGATATERWRLQSTRPIPLRLAEEARMFVEEVRLAHAYDGLYFDYGNNPDTQKLILHSLQRMPGWSPEVRLEVRHASLSGVLLDAIGDADAPIRKILIKAGNRYQTYDGHEQMLHGLDDIYASVLHALPDPERAALGFPATGQGQALKEALAQQAPMSRAALRALLDMPAVKPDAQSPLRLARGREGYPRFEAKPALCPRSPGGCLQTHPRRIRYLLHKLFPMHAQETIEGFLNIEDMYSRAGLNRLEELNMEYKAQLKLLKQWINEPPEVVRISETYLRPVSIRDKEYVAQLVMKCWRRYTRGSTGAAGNKLDLTGFHLAKLPPLSGDFSHVTSLRINYVYLDSRIDDFLTKFKNLKILKLESADLRRLPESLFDMGSLRKLFLQDNRITLTPETARKLAGMTHLQVIDLSENPLRVFPNFTHMDQLQSLNLSSTGLTQWPASVERLPRLSTLDLRANSITHLPNGYYQIPPRRLAGIYLHGNPLDLPSYDQVFNLRDSLGLPQEAREHALPSVEPVTHWLTEGLSETDRTAKQQRWSALLAEPDNRSFFKVINDLTHSADYSFDRQALTDKVWRILDAAAQDSEFREELFAGATEHDNCVDRAATVFSRFGFKYLLRQAELLEGTAKEDQLLTLMRGRVRLLELDDIAQTQFQLQTARYNNAVSDGVLSRTEIARLKPDRLEVQLIYQVDLAQRLELPWQSTHMKFRAQALTSRQQIEQAYQIVINKEAYPGFMAQKLLEQGVWRDYIEATYSADIELENATAQQRFASMDTLQDKQQLWADTLNSDDETARAALRTELSSLAQTLGIDEQQVFTGQPMPEADYLAEVLRLDEQKKRTLQLITQRILDRKPPSASAQE